jgi:hypothetical protein
MRRILLALALTVVLAAPAMAGPASVNIDGTIGATEWTGAATYTIGNGGGTAYFFADTSFIYGAFDLTGWTESDLSVTTHGFLLGFGVWKTSGGYGVNGVEFQQGSSESVWGGDGNSGTMNGLVSAWRINAQSPPAASIPGTLQAANAFTDHRVWEVMMPISTMGVSGGDTIWVVSGIDYGGLSHWTPSDFISSHYTSYAPVTVGGGASVPDGGATLMLLGSALVGLGALRRKFRG